MVSALVSEHDIMNDGLVLTEMPFQICLQKFGAESLNKHLEVPIRGLFSNLLKLL